MMKSLTAAFLLMSVFGGMALGAGSEEILKTPDLVAFWDFQEGAGQPRLSKGGSRSYALLEKAGEVADVDGGVFGPKAAEIRYGQRFQIDRKDIGELDIHGKDAQVTVMAWVMRRDKQSWQAIAGAWDETRAKRQYCLFLNAPTATRSDEMKRYPVKERLHGHVSSVGGGTPGNKYCITYSSGGTAVPFGEWQCVAMSYDGKASRVYLNGKLDSWELRNPFPYEEGIFDGGAEGADFTVGAVNRSKEWGNFFGGRIGGLAVFKRALTEVEMLRLYQAGQAQPK